MNPREAVAERDRLLRLLAAYDDDRAKRQTDDQQAASTREIPPDRAAKVRARIAGLNEIIDGGD